MNRVSFFSCTGTSHACAVGLFVSTMYDMRYDWPDILGRATYVYKKIIIIESKLSQLTGGPDP